MQHYVNRKRKFRKLERPLYRIGKQASKKTYDYCKGKDCIVNYKAFMSGAAARTGNCRNTKKKMDNIKNMRVLEIHYKKIRQ